MESIQIVVGAWPIGLMVVTERHGEASVIINPVDDHVVSELLGTRNIWCRVHGFNPRVHGGYRAARGSERHNQSG